jgi:hypothetical protein
MDANYGTCKMVGFGISGVQHFYHGARMVVSWSIRNVFQNRNVDGSFTGVPDYSIKHDLYFENEILPKRENDV